MDHLPAAIVLHRQVLHREGHLPRVALAPIHDKLHIAADHERREIVLVRLGRLALADNATAPDDRDPVGDLQHLVQLVADEDDAVPLVGQPAEHAEDFLRLLGGKHGRWLVEHEDPCLAVERL